MIKMVKKKQAAKKKKMISISAARIKKMGEKQLLKTMSKAEYEKVFTDVTWSRLQRRHDVILYGPKKARERAAFHRKLARRK